MCAASISSARRDRAAAGQIAETATTVTGAAADLTASQAAATAMATAPATDKVMGREAAPAAADGIATSPGDRASDDGPVVARRSYRRGCEQAVDLVGDRPGS